MTWPEEFSRYCYIWTVFLSLGYTIKKGNMLKVGLVMDLLPQKIRRAIEILANLIILAICVVFFRYSITYTGIIHKTGQISPAMHIPMWIMYLSTVLGFGMASIRTAQEVVSNIKNFNVKAETTLEATIKEAKEEVKTTGIKIDDDFKNSGGEE
jgi:TRAP-type C4-dicarboxylate transport system permease small subunit